MATESLGAASKIAHPSADRQGKNPAALPVSLGIFSLVLGMLCLPLFMVQVVRSSVGLSHDGNGDRQPRSSGIQFYRWRMNPKESSVAPPTPSKSRLRQLD